MSRNNIYKNLLVISASFVGLVSHTSVLALANTDSNKTVVNNSQSHVEQDTINLTVTDQKIRAYSKMVGELNAIATSEYTAIIKASLMQAYARLDFSSVSKLNESIDLIFGPYIDKWHDIYESTQLIKGRKVFQELRNEIRTILTDKTIAMKFYNAYGQAYLNSGDLVLKAVGKYMLYAILISEEKGTITIDLSGSNINIALRSKGIQGLSQDKFSAEWISQYVNKDLFDFKNAAGKTKDDANAYIISLLASNLDDFIAAQVLKLFPSGKQFKTFSSPTKAEMKTINLMKLKVVFQTLRSAGIQYAQNK